MWASPPDQCGRSFAYGTRAGGQCQLDAYQDGARTVDGNVNLVRRDEIAGIEVYLGLEVPPEYSRVGNCGVVLIWSKTP